MTAQPRRPASTDLDAPLDPLSEAALAWLVRLHDGTAAEADWAGYDTWQTASPAHQRAAREAEALWQSIGPAIQRPQPRRKTGPALIALLALGLGLWLTTLTGLPRDWLADLRTGTGELRSVTLADGSQLLLDADSSIDIDIAAGHRRLTLHRGALQVQVSADPARPFEVLVAGGTIRALGTAFEVRRLDNAAARVTVSEHAVSVAYDGGLRQVDSGQSLQFGPGLLSQSQAADLRSLTAWQRGRLVFDARPLGQVADELQRYHPGLILIPDEALRRLPVTGVFETADAEALVDAVAAILPVKVTRLPWLTVIRNP